MMKVSCNTYWSWTIVNDKGEKCLEIEDIYVSAHCKTNATDVEDLVVESVAGDYPERTGLAWVHHRRDLPKWLADAALAAARKEIESSDSTLYQTLVESAQEEYYALGADAREAERD